MNKLPSTIGIAVIGFAALCVITVAALVWHGSDPGPLVTFIGTLVPLTIGVVVVAAKVDKVQQTTDDVAHNVNGKLNAQFEAIHERLDAAGVPATDVVGKHESLDTDERPTTLDS